jgi:hypothetical protein
MQTRKSTKSGTLKLQKLPGRKETLLEGAKAMDRPKKVLEEVCPQEETSLRKLVLNEKFII